MKSKKNEDYEDYEVSSSKTKKLKVKHGKKEKIVKRLQVSKACTNCRKMHTACDSERPCKRCNQHGLTDSCVDLARKKRLTKKQLLEKEEKIKMEMNNGPTSPSPPIKSPSHTPVNAGCDDDVNSKECEHEHEEHEHDDDVIAESDTFKSNPLKRKVDKINPPSPLSNETNYHINADVIALALGLAEDSVFRSYDIQSANNSKSQIRKASSYDYSTLNEVIGINDECKEIIKDMKSWDLSLPQNSWKLGLDQFQKEHNFYPTDSFLFDYTNLSNEDPLVATNIASQTILPQSIIHQAQLVIQQQQLHEQEQQHQQLLQSSQPQTPQQFTPQTSTPTQQIQSTPLTPVSTPVTPQTPLFQTNPRPIQPQQQQQPQPQPQPQNNAPSRNMFASNPFVSQSVLPNLSNMELNYLIQQIAELKDTNKSLENQLNELNKEKEKLLSPPQQHHVTSPPPPTTPLQVLQQTQSVDPNLIWNSCVYSQTSLSLWKKSENGLITLVECNDKFAELLGFQLADLSIMIQNGFSWTNLNVGVDILHQTGWPKKVQILTNVGVKDVYLTVNSIQGDNKSFMLQATEMMRY